MNVLLISDNVWVTSKLQSLFEASDLLSNFSHLQSPLGLTEQRRSEGNFDIVFVVLNEDFETAKGDLSFLKLALHVCVVAVGSVSSPEQMIEYLHSGADDFLDTNRDLDAQLGKVLKNIKTRFGFKEKPNNLISLIGASGGVGTSSVAVNLAALMTEKATTGLIDLVLEGGDLDRLLSLNPTHTIRELCQNSSGIDCNLIERSIVKHSSGVALLAAGRSDEATEQIHTNLVQEFTSLCRGMFENLILDLGSTQRFRDHSEVIDQSTSIVLLFRPDFPSICNAKQKLNQLESMNCDMNKVNPVANFYGMPIQIPLDKIEIILERKVRFTIQNDPTLMNLSVNCGVPAVLESPKSKLTQSFKELVKHLLSEHNNNSETTREMSSKTNSGIAAKSLSFLKQSVGTFSF